MAPVKRQYRENGYQITSGTFVELADLLAENLCAQEAEPQTYLDGKLLVAPAKKGWQRSPTFSHGFWPLPFTSGSSTVLALLGGRIQLSIKY